MRAWELHEPVGLESLKLVDRPEPTPGPGEVQMRMRAASLNYRDLLVCSGAYSRSLPLPLVPLSDGVGEVVATGPGVTRVKVGQRVAGCFMQRWLGGELTDSAAKSALGGGVQGILAEQVVLHEDGVVPVPEHLTDVEAATLPCAGVTAWNALVTQGRIKAGDTVLILGTGGVSLFALQFAKIQGARVLITSRSNEKLSRALRLGADEGINTTEVPEWDRRARELTGGSGVDHVVEVGGAGTLEKSLRAVRTGGQVSMIGVLGGGAGNIGLFPVLMKAIRIQGIYVGSREMFEAMNRAAVLHQLHPVIDREFPFQEFPSALAALQRAEHFGKIGILVR